MERLPEKFILKMKKQLPENEWGAFFDVYQNPPLKGVRFNPLKGGRYALKLISPLLKEPVPWEENGYYTDENKLGASPYHFAGLFYSQEPSAMLAAPLLEVKAGEKVLDLCSAPGGKGTQLAASMQGEGILVLNEPVFSRAKILSQNVERMGVKNAIVLSELPEKLSEKFAGYFDKILVDAPCSGEGMFRKNADEALSEWSEENVEKCAARQKYILDEATKMLRVGGKLVYSTCTFSTEEDEGQLRDYLLSHPQMRLLKEEKIYPHKAKGEGHFAAVFKKETGEEISPQIRPLKRFVSRETEKAARAFEKDFFKESVLKNLHEAGGALYALPDGVFDFKGLQVLRAGVKVGEMKNGRFEPNHALAMSAKAEECKRVVNLSQTDARVEKYLRGETIDFDIENGWCAVCIEGITMGLGKAVNGTVKNHLPKALRANAISVAEI